MTKIFIDTSVFIRFLTQDDKEKFKKCSELFELVEEGRIRPYSSNIVILEIHYVLTRIYNFAKNQVIQDIENVLSLRNLTLIEKTKTKKALILYKKHSIKYADSLIYNQVPDGVTLITYDHEFSKLEPITNLTPANFIDSLK